MRRRICLLPLSWLGIVGLMVAVAGAADAPKPGQQVAGAQKVKTADGEEVELRYWLFLPSNYEEKEAWPLMLFLHGAGERGTDLELVKKWGPPSLVAERKDFPFIVVSPQCPMNQRWEASSLAALVDHLHGELKVDAARLYCTGLSMGGYGTWDLLARYPKLFAAGVPICGGGDPEKAAQLQHIPIWAFHGDQDTAVPVSRSQDMVDAIAKLGGKAKLTIYPGVGHNSWSATYANEDVYQWLLSHRRQAD